MNKNVCSPNKLKITEYTCFTKNDLILIAFYYNKKNPNDNINLQQDKYNLWLSIYKKFKKYCSNETCWLDNNFFNIIPNNTEIRDKLFYFTFKPKLSKHEFNWINNKDIDNVMKQYQHKFSNSFEYIGTFSCDFYKFIDINFKQNKNYYGIICNIDKHSESGSHWIAIFINNINKTIEYFDSLGKPPNRCLQKFITLLNKNLNYELKQNYIKHQYQNSECGIYSMYFIIQRLYGKTFENITSKRISDNSMKIFRKHLFRY